MLVPGIGKKTAARLVIELKSRLGEGADSGPSVVGRQTGEGQAEAATRNELRAALAALGYSADEIRQTLLDLPAEGNVEDLLRQALRGLAVSR
jgi:Holliday junction DNA helicase RuvA